MTLKEQLRADLATALREGNTSKRDALRTLLAAIKQTEVDERITLDDAGVQAVLVKQTKQRRESIADYEKAGRPDLLAKEKNDLAVIESYLPQLMDREEIRQVAVNVMAEMGITDSKGMGQLMGRLMPQLKGKADGRVVNEVVRELLQSK
jgi:uncharacterized protein YqeY